MPDLPDVYAGGFADDNRMEGDKAMTSISTRSLSTARRFSVPLLAVAATMMLASCGSIYPSTSHPDSANWGQPQKAGWATSPQIREAEEKSIARDMPYASVTAAGAIVQN
ncbi:hypothetical protein D3C71_256650 [compost metagenome]